MKGKQAALSWSVIHSIGDTLEEKILLTYNEYQYLFWMNFITGIFTFFFTLLGGIEITLISFCVIVLYSLAMVGGDFCYTKAIQTLPIGLANLIDSGSLFIILICDIALGYIKPRLIFFVLFLIFFFSIYLFSYETNKMKSEIKNKKIDLKNIFILITSTIFYASEPYFIKLASSKGANEFGINLIYIFVSIPIFYVLYQKRKKEIPKMEKKSSKNFYMMCIVTGFIFAITSILNQFAYIESAPILVTLIMKLQLFFVVMISVIQKTDKMNWKKILSLIIGVICIICMTLIS